MTGRGKIDISGDRRSPAPAREHAMCGGMKPSTVAPGTASSLPSRSGACMRGLDGAIRDSMEKELYPFGPCIPTPDTSLAVLVTAMSGLTSIRSMWSLYVAAVQSQAVV